MTEPHQLSMEALMAEEGLFTSAGLPDSLRAKWDAERAAREKADRILNEIAVHEAALAKLHAELRQTLNEFPSGRATAA